MCVLWKTMLESLLLAKLKHEEVMTIDLKVQWPKMIKKQLKTSNP